jgi:hypothetical protein
MLLIFSILLTLQSFAQFCYANEITDDVLLVGLLYGGMGDAFGKENREINLLA